jgi:ATP-binding cassette subfamily B protein
MSDAQLPHGIDAPSPEILRLSGISKHFPGVKALNDVDFDLRQSEVHVLFGENGAGKSTLIKLLCGLYDPAGGRVTLDGAPPLEARGRIAVIFQDFVRYALPLRVNVAFGNLSLAHDPDALEGALRDAGGAGLLASLPLGWDTVLSREFEGGADLSGGQWQRVALARALAAVRGGAGLLILDEPTASLDVRAETELFERFLEVTRDVTTILVSHRLASVRHADRIVVIEDGRVAEDGTHDALMRSGGLYARMFSLQAERFAAAPAAANGAEVPHA